MTNERAIELLHRLQDEQFDGPHGDERREALEMAIRAMEETKTAGSGSVDSEQPEIKTDRTIGDSINRQQAIDAVNELTKWYYDTYHENRPTSVAVIDKLMDLPSVQSEQHWIPCSERLPEKRKENEDTEYLVTIDNGEFKYVTSDYWINWFGIWRWNDSEAIAWMPFPELYGGESDD